MANPLRALLVAFSIFMALMLTVPIVDNLSENAADPDEWITRDAALLEDTSTFITLNDGEGVNETVYKTTGYAVNLTGADDSFIQSSESVDFATDENWTVSVWAQPDVGNVNMTAVSLNGRVVVFWNGTAGNWSAWFFDEGSTNSFQVNVSDNGSAVGNLTNVIVKANSTHLAIYRNNTLGDVKPITGDSITSAPVNNTNWDGRLEEIRVFDEELDATNRSELVNSPVEQQPDLNRTARIMFDQPDKDTQLLLFASGHITQSNVTFSAGHPEDIMDPPSLSNQILGDTDYEWRAHGPAIRPVSGRELDGAPVAYVSYDFGSDLVNDMVVSISDALALAALVPMLIIIMVILSKVRGV